MENQRVRVHAFLSGMVQGVGLRYFVNQRASSMPITGWVRNLRDGRVELVAEGSRTDLETFIADVKQGPRGAQVTDVDLDWGDADGSFSSFGVMSTA
ncbi:MAG: acylphosphatase [Anaerolineales bacterium]